MSTDHDSRSSLWNFKKIEKPFAETVSLLSRIRSTWILTTCLQGWPNETVRGCCSSAANATRLCNQKLVRYHHTGWLADDYYLGTKLLWLIPHPYNYLIFSTGLLRKLCQSRPNPPCRQWSIGAARPCQLLGYSREGNGGWWKRIRCLGSALHGQSLRPCCRDFPLQKSGKEGPAKAA